MSALVFAGGVVTGVAVTALGWWALLVRPLRADLAELQRKKTVLIAALRPFAPIKVRKVTLTVPLGARWHYWTCGACSPYGLLGGSPHEVASLGRTNDDAREHYLDHHLTREHIDGAGRALAYALDTDRWWKR